MIPIEGDIHINFWKSISVNRNESSVYSMIVDSSNSSLVRIHLRGCIADFIFQEPRACKPFFDRLVDQITPKKQERGGFQLFDRKSYTS